MSSFFTKQEKGTSINDNSASKRLESRTSLTSTDGGPQSEIDLQMQSFCEDATAGDKVDVEDDCNNDDHETPSDEESRHKPLKNLTSRTWSETMLDKYRLFVKYNSRVISRICLVLIVFGLVCLLAGALSERKPDQGYTQVGEQMNNRSDVSILHADFNIANMTEDFGFLMRGMIVNATTTEETATTTAAIPVDGFLTPWRVWGSCSKSCEVGSMTRTRSCVPPKNGGRSCSGELSSKSFCNTHACPVDGYLTPWSVWGSCSASCGGGVRSRTRSCVPPKFGGNSCSGELNPQSRCNTHACPVDSKWTIWAGWSYGGGERSRDRHCTPPAHGGKPCSGSSNQKEICAASTCPSITQKWKINVGTCTGHGNAGSDADVHMKICNIKHCSSPFEIVNAANNFEIGHHRDNFYVTTNFLGGINIDHIIIYQNGFFYRGFWSNGQDASWGMSTMMISEQTPGGRTCLIPGSYWIYTSDRQFSCEEYNEHGDPSNVRCNG